MTSGTVTGSKTIFIYYHADNAFANNGVTWGASLPNIEYDNGGSSWEDQESSPVLQLLINIPILC